MSNTVPFSCAVLRLAWGEAGAEKANVATANQAVLNQHVLIEIPFGAKRYVLVTGPKNDRERVCNNAQESEDLRLELSIPTMVQYAER